jgi:hypothetical protein
MSSQELKDRVFDEMLCLAARHRAKELAQELPLDSEIMHPHTFSDGFKDEMRKMISRHKRDQNRGKYRGFLAKTAVILVALTWLLMAKVDAVRLPVMNFYLDVYEKFSKIIIEDGNITSTRLPQQKDIYLPAYIPHEYEVIDVIDEPEVYIVTYADDEGNTIVFKQSDNIKGISIDTEDSEVLEMEIHGNNAIVAIKEEQIIALMITPEKAFFLTTHLDLATTIQIMESIKL